MREEVAVRVDLRESRVQVDIFLFNITIGSVCSRLKINKALCRVKTYHVFLMILIGLVSKSLCKVEKTQEKHKCLSTTF